MKKLIAKSLQNPLISGSSVIFLGAQLGNFFHLLFNVLMGGYLLSVTEFGILASILSLTTLPSLLYSAIAPTVVNFAATYFANKELDHVHGLYKKINNIALVVGSIFFLIFTLFSSHLSAFFHIESDKSLIIIAGVMVFIGFVSVVNISLIQAKLAFNYLSLLNFLSGFLKFSFGALFVLLGLKVGGALGGILATGIVVYILSFIPIRFIFQKKVDVPNIPLKEIAAYALPATITLISISCFITVDILLVKHFYHPQQAGLYAGLALIGKIIFFFSSPIGMVMFPLIVQKKAKNENYNSIFFLSMVLVLIPSTLLTAFYYLFPEFAVQFVLRKPEYLEIANTFWLYGLYMTIYSLLTVLTNYFLSIKKTSVWVPLSIGAALQAILIWQFHTTFVQVVTISIVIVFILLLILMLYYLYFYKKEKK